jgi:type II secretory pathway component PulK
MRWVIGCMVFFAAAELLQPQPGGALAAIFGFVLVLAYAATTIAMERQPSRLLSAFAPDLVARREAPSVPDGEQRRSRLSCAPHGARR